jgi:hypothetical protein
VNVDPSDMPGVPYIGVPTETEDLILAPGGRQQFVDVNIPLLFTGESTAACPSEAELEIIVSLGTKETLTQYIRIQFDGSSRATEIDRQFVCGIDSLELLTISSSSSYSEIGGAL